MGTRDSFFYSFIGEIFIEHLCVVHFIKVDPVLPYIGAGELESEENQNPVFEFKHTRRKGEY